MNFEQTTIFDFIEKKKLKLLSLFSGIGGFEKALNNLNIDYELVNYCEIDKYASKSYSLIHNVSEDENLWDITTVDTSKLSKDIDLITYGFPCQDISLVGKQKGFEHNGERTRSGLFFEALRIIEDTKPKYAIAENVKNLTSKKFKNEFEIVLKSLENAGYNNYWKVLNAKDYGIPQNRERVFIVSIRKDIDEGFAFPNKLNEKDLVIKYLRIDYSKENFDSCPNDTPSRRKIWERNKKIIDEDYNYCDCISTITTKQDRHPNSGVIFFPNLVDHKSNFRYLSPRETLLFMGFKDEDYNKIAKHIKRDEIYKQAGNSIVVNVLEEIFKILLKK